MPGTLATRMLKSSDDITALLSLVAEGNSIAFEALYQATSLKLFGICVRILRRQELAEEILQEVYVRIWDKAETFDASRASPITWMATIARNHALDEVRKRKPEFADDSAGVDQISDPGRNPAEQLETSQEVRRLDACLDKLDAPRRNAVRLAYLDGMSRAEIAGVLDQPVGTIKTWLHRSLKQLKECLGS